MWRPLKQNPSRSSDSKAVQTSRQSWKSKTGGREGKGWIRRGCERDEERERHKEMQKERWRGGPGRWRGIWRGRAIEERGRGRVRNREKGKYEKELKGISLTTFSSFSLSSLLSPPSLPAPHSFPSSLILHSPSYLSFSLPRSFPFLPIVSRLSISLPSLSCPLLLYLWYFLERVDTTDTTGFDTTWRRWTSKIARRDRKQVRKMDTGI